MTSRVCGNLAGVTRLWSIPNSKRLPGGNILTARVSAAGLENIATRQVIEKTEGLSSKLKQLVKNQYLDEFKFVNHKNILENESPEKAAEYHRNFIAAKKTS